jgi:hypothetical protein
MRSWIVALAGLLLVLWSGSAAATDLRASFSPGELSAAHRDDDGEPLSCEACHERGEGVSEALCLSCHGTIARLQALRTGFHATSPEGCAECHAEHRGEGVDLAAVDIDAFDHARTGFPLTQGHADVRCSTCHAPDSWLGAETECGGCHEQVHGHGFREPDRLARCESCHDVQRFAEAGPPAYFDHGTQTRYALAGNHGEMPCADCHREGHFAPIAHAVCSDCHEDPHRRATGECADCHEATNWTQVPRRTHDRLGFALRGLHGVVACDSCHSASTVTPVPHGSCTDCHQDPHAGALTGACVDCHDVQAPAWEPSGLDHQIAWPLLGAHQSTPCATCHGPLGSRQWTGIEASTCGACHDDPHGDRFEGQDCGACHGEEGWTGIDDFDHSRTGQALAGKHQGLTCAQCHPDGSLKHSEMDDCVACHEDPHSGAVPLCTSCHDVEQAWRTTDFDHQPTGFELSQAHEKPRCRSCHQNDRFEGAKPACRSCHGTEAPGRHFPQDCAVCHPPTVWSESQLDVAAHAVIGFPLEGAHERVQCASCHADQLAAPLCIDCHSSDDPHQNQLGDDCAACHRTRTWLRSTWRHSQIGWPLRGEHRVADCVDCHAAGFVGTPRECSACHPDGCTGCD